MSHNSLPQGIQGNMSLCYTLIALDSNVYDVEYSTMHNNKRSVISNKNDIGIHVAIHDHG